MSHATEEFDDVELDTDLDTQIRPVIQPIFEQILSCYDKSDESLKPFAECIQSKVPYLARRAIHYVQSNQGDADHNKRYVHNLIRHSAQECINNGRELGLDVSRWQAMFQCIMGSCEQYVDLLISLLMRDYSQLMSRPANPRSTSGVVTRRSPPRSSRLSPRNARLSPRSSRLSPRNSRLSPRSNRISPRSRRLSPQNARLVRLSPRNARLSPRNSHQSPRRYNSMTLSRR